ncbi:ROK family protein [Dysgonomonas termitidis]|uniref:ROK family protein n=1 Tax=Dysgonomonas termitidis TaxID=1516126 RepID=A0ABV9L3D9_9BACT
MAVIGIDLGGTKIIGAIFNNEGYILEKKSSLLLGKKGKDVGTLVMHIIDELIDSYNGSDSDIKAIGICVPGIANSKTKKVWAPNIKGWEDYPLHEEIEIHINNPSVKVDIASDRTCYILGEAWKGSAMGCSNALFVAVGTGIGVGILSDGHVLHGHGDIVGAAGWMALGLPYEKDYELCGCFESHASGDGIAYQAKKILKEGTSFNDSSLRTIDIQSIKAKDVFVAYEEGDALAKYVLDNAIRMWGMAAANLVSLFNPEKIIWGGGVFGPAAYFFDQIYKEACKWAQPISIKQVNFEKSYLGGEAGLLGAGYLAILSLK